MDLKYQYFGNGWSEVSPAPLVILHGMFGMGENWQGIAQELSKNRSVWTIDLPGHGQSYRENEQKISYHYTDLAKAVSVCLEGIKNQSALSQDQKFIICGHSMGAKIGMALALLQPKLVKGLVAVDSGPIDYRNRGYNQDVLKMLAEMQLAGYQDRMAASQAMSRWVPDPALQGFLLKGLKKNQDGYLQWRFDAAGLLRAAADIADWPFEQANFQPFQGPALFLAGALSDYVSLPDDEKIIHAYFPNATIEQIPQARHWVHVDNRVVFLMHLSEFLLTIG